VPRSTGTILTTAMSSRPRPRGCPGGRRSLRWRSPPEPCRVW
jgi:hypothetical protein